jgi:hypothetical protein
MTAAGETAKNGLDTSTIESRLKKNLNIEKHLEMILVVVKFKAEIFEQVLLYWI